MKILIVHSYYQIRGGEDAVFEQEKNLLQDGNEVERLAFKNKTGIKGAIQFLFSIWNPLIRRQVRKKIKIFHPSVIHIHNWHFACGPAVIRVAKDLRIPVVLTLHNYRLLCPSASLMNKERLFLDSISQGFPWVAVREKVYRNSFIQTFWLACVVWFHKKVGTWRLVDKYIVLTPFAKTLFQQSTLGLTENQLVVKPNYVAHSKVVNTQRNGFLFVGRLTEEKGIKVLLQAFSKLDFDLKIAGEGPLAEEVEAAAKLHSNIQYLGRLNKEAIIFNMFSSEALIFPSLWYEGMPMTILESFSAGTPVIASRVGAMESMINDHYNGLHFEVGNAEDLASKLNKWRALNEAEKLQLQQNAFQTYLNNYTPEYNRAQLLKIYDSMQVAS